MQRTTTLRGGLLVAAALIAGLVAAFLATRSSGADSSHARVVMTAKNPTLHKTILVNRHGMTLYALSAERHGRFICTNMACLNFWTPLTVAKGKTPSGVSGLGIVKRPGGKRQVAYKGAPLYTFNSDEKRGDVEGNGFKDVGTWHVVAVGSRSSAPAPTSSTPYHY